jgi:hypothetical protein
MRLQTARRAKNEDPLQFADRYSGLEQNIICKVDDPVAQCIHYETSERMLFASFVTELTGVPGRQVR